MNNKIINLTEQQVLETLDIPDFRHLSKDKIITFFSMIPSMNSGVAQKAIEQLSLYANVVKDVVVNFMELLNTALVEGSKRAQLHYNSCNAILTALLQELKKDDLTFENKRYIIDQTIEVESRMREILSDEREFNIEILKIGADVMLACILGVVAMFATNSRSSFPKVKS